MHHGCEERRERKKGGRRDRSRYGGERVKVNSEFIQGVVYHSLE